MCVPRIIKPSFFHNEDLAELSYEIRLLLIGLWCLADREGRLENRPKKIMMKLFPADDLDMPNSLLDLESINMITMYSVGDSDYIQINNFFHHHCPSREDPHSTIPDQGGSKPILPDITDPNKTLDQYEVNHYFDIFWKAGMKKTGKKKCESKFKSITNNLKNQSLSEFIKMLVEDINLRMKSNQLGFSEMHPTTYLNGERWNDEITARTNYETNSNQRNFETPTDRSTRAADELRRKQASYAENDISVQTHD